MTFIDTCTVNVQQGVTDVWIDKETLSLILGTQGQLNAIVWPSDAYNKNVSWASEDESIATVSQDGVVSAVSQGTTAVTATTQQGGLVDSCTVYVTLTSIAVEGVNLSSNSEVIEIGGEVRLGYTINPANATNSDVTWSSSDESIAQVDNGIVTSKGVGSVIITVTTQDGGFTDTCDIVVTSESDIIVFPDDNLKQALLDRGVDTNNSGEVTQTEMAALTEELNLNNTNISDLTGIEYAVNLKDLKLKYNHIVNTTPISGMTNLIFLDLAQNDIADIASLSGLVNIEELFLSWNDIIDISALSNMSNLTRLEMAWNECDNIDALAQLYRLEYIDFERNSIADIGALANLTNLKSLDLSVNGFKSIAPLENLNKMQNLSIRANQIGDIYSLRNMTQLKYLDISYIKANYHDPLLNFGIVSNFTNLEALWAPENKIWDISALADLTQLKVLDISGNHIRDISSLSRLANLYELDLSSNPIDDISVVPNLSSLYNLALSETSVTDISALSGRSSLRVLDISINPISDISVLSTLVNLISLDITNCMVDNIDVLEDLPLDTLYAKYNEFDISSGSQARGVIDVLQSRGCQVEFDPQGNRFILAPGFLVNRTIPAIVSLKPGTTVAELKQGLNGDTALMRFLNVDNGSLNNSSIVTTGSHIYLDTEEEFDGMGIVILGDTSYDGRIRIDDYTLARLDILGLKDLNDIQSEAADINGDGVVSIMDYTLIRLDILGLKNIH